MSAGNGRPHQYISLEELKHKLIRYLYLEAQGVVTPEQLQELQYLKTELDCRCEEDEKCEASENLQAELGLTARGRSFIASRSYQFLNKVDMAKTFFNGVKPNSSDMCPEAIISKICSYNGRLAYQLSLAENFSQDSNLHSYITSSVASNPLLHFVVFNFGFTKQLNDIISRSLKGKNGVINIMTRQQVKLSLVTISNRNFKDIPVLLNNQRDSARTAVILFFDHKEGLDNILASYNRNQEILQGYRILLVKVREGVLCMEDSISKEYLKQQLELIRHSYFLDLSDSDYIQKIGSFEFDKPPADLLKFVISLLPYCEMSSSVKLKR